MERTIEYQRAGVFRRICSALFDLIIFTILFVLAQSFVVAPIIQNGTDYNTLYKQYETICIESKLTKYVDSGLGETSLSVINKNDELVAFYNDNTLGVTLEDYNNARKDLKITYEGVDYPLFSLNEENVYIEYNTSDNSSVNEKLQEARTKFYMEKASELFNKFYEQNVEFQKIYARLDTYSKISWTVSIISSSLIVFLLFPLVFKDRATLGKKMFRFQVVNTRTGLIASRFQTFARFVYFELIYIGLPNFVLFLFNQAFTILTMGFFFILSAVFVVVNKKRQLLHDLIAHTAVVNIDILDRNVSEQELIDFTYDDGQPEEIIDGEVKESSISQTSEANYSDSEKGLDSHE